VAGQAGGRPGADSHGSRSVGSSTQTTSGSSVITASSSRCGSPQLPVLPSLTKLPSGVFRPYAGVSTAILLFTKTNSGGTDHVWFYDVEADGWSLDDKRTPLLPEDQLGPVPRYGHGSAVAFDPANHHRNNLADIVARWPERGGSERRRGGLVEKLLKSSGGCSAVELLDRAGIRGGVEIRPLPLGESPTAVLAKRLTKLAERMGDERLLGFHSTLVPPPRFTRRPRASIVSVTCFASLKGCHGHVTHGEIPSPNHLGDRRPLGGESHGHSQKRAARH
jgi:hypothetical protein